MPLFEADLPLKNFVLLLRQHRKQTAVSVEVANENAELYYAIQRENPENDAALRNLEEAVSRVRTLPKDEFISMMQDEAVWYQ